MAKPAWVLGWWCGSGGVGVVVVVVWVWWCAQGVVGEVVWVWWCGRGGGMGDVLIVSTQPLQTNSHGKDVQLAAKDAARALVGVCPGSKGTQHSGQTARSGATDKWRTWARGRKEQGYERKSPSPRRTKQAIAVHQRRRVRHEDARLIYKVPLRQRRLCTRMGHSKGHATHTHPSQFPFRTQESRTAQPPSSPTHVSHPAARPVPPSTARLM